jgi:hypothetical protein
MDIKGNDEAGKVGNKRERIYQDLSWGIHNIVLLSKGMLQFAI